MKLGRLITAMVTPFNREGEVDYKKAGELALKLIESGSDGVVVSGTTGESPTLSKEEKLRLFAEVKEAVGSKGAVIAGTGSYSTKDSISLTKEAEKIGVDAVLLVTPYYNRPTQEGLYKHFAAIASETSLPCILYNVPSRTAVNLNPETVIRLSEIENIVGIKEASGNLAQIAKIIEGARKGFLVYSGNDADTFSILALGGYGVISVVSHLVGRQFREMIEKVVSGEIEEAAGIHRRLLPLMEVLFILPNPIPIKHALNFLGFEVGDPRLPLTPATPEAARRIEETLARYTIDFPLPERI